MHQGAFVERWAMSLFLRMQVDSPEDTPQTSTADCPQDML